MANKLVLIEPGSAGGKIEIAKGFDLSGAAGDGKIAVCALDSCPEGMSAKESLEALGVFSSVEPKLVQAANIQNTLTLVSRGEAKFGIVYATAAKADPAVKMAGTFPASSHRPVAYAGALTEVSVNPDAADFLSYLSRRRRPRSLPGKALKYGQSDDRLRPRQNSSRQRSFNASCHRKRDGQIFIRAHREISEGLSFHRVTRPAEAFPRRQPDMETGSSVPASRVLLRAPPPQTIAMEGLEGKCRKTLARLAAVKAVSVAAASSVASSSTSSPEKSFRSSDFGGGTAKNGCARSASKTL